MPKQGLRRDDSDTAIIVVINTAMFMNPVHDPWLLAQKSSTYKDGKNIVPVYRAESPNKAMGCAIQVSDSSSRDMNANRPSINFVSRLRLEIVAPSWQVRPRIYILPQNGRERVQYRFPL